MNDLTFYLAGLIFFLIISIFKEKPKLRDERFVQLRNPKTKKYVKIDKVKGLIVAHKKTRGPYKGIRIGN